jgi:capsular exopolysaccharide synthesis family protein
MANYNVISKEQPDSVISEQYRKLKTNIEFTSIDESVQVVNVTSTHAGEGKSVTALNLATVYAQGKIKTLIVDMDLRRPKLHRAFRLPNRGGLGGYFSNQKEIGSFIQKVDDHLDVLVAGDKLPFPAEVLASRKIKEMINTLKTKYDKIIIDCPPVSVGTDTMLISNFSDGTVFVVASRHTKYDVAKAQLDELKKAGANILGGVVTKLRKRDQFYGASYYYYYSE